MCCFTWSYVVSRNAKIRTPIARSCRGYTKCRISQALKWHSFGFDSHRPQFVAGCLSYYGNTLPTITHCPLRFTHVSVKRPASEYSAPSRVPDCV
jgi:hypothetical protein